MPIFRYRAYDSSGREVRGTIEAAGAREAAARLRKEGLFPRDLHAGGRERRLRPFLHPGRRGASRELASFSRQLSTLLASGASLHDSLEILVREAGKGPLGPILVDVKERIAGGSSLARALEAQAGVFPVMYCRMVEAGEEAGNLDAVTANLADYLEARQRIAEKVQTALVYPLLMTVVGAGVLTFLLIFVVPRITTIFEDTRTALPLVTVVLLRITGLLRHGWPLFLAGAAALVFVLPRVFRRPGPRALFERLVLRTPVLGSTVRKFYLATMARTLGSLLQGGVGLLTALGMTGRVLDSAVFGSVLERASRDVTEGGDLSRSFESSGVLPEMMVYMTAIGERSGQLPAMLLKAAEGYEREFNTSVDRALALMEPLLILAMGAVVGFIVLAILLPIFELNQIVG